MVTLSLDGAGRYFVSFMVEEQIEVAPQRPAAVGIDLGLKSLEQAWRLAMASAVTEA